MVQQKQGLIILGVMIAVIAVFFGVSHFTADSGKANREAVISDLKDIAVMAQKYYREPITLNGGAHSFTGLKIPDNLAQTPDMNTRVFSEISSQSILLVGTGREKGNDGNSPVKVTALVGPTDITSITVNN